MKLTTLFIALTFVLLGCHNSDDNQESSVKNSKETKDDSNLKTWLFNSKSIGKRIEGDIQRSRLIDLLREAFTREFEQPYKFDIFSIENLDLLEFYEYPEFQFGNVKFESYYAKIDYEDASYDLLFIVNPEKKGSYNSLILYEKLDSEQIYNRLSKTKSPFIESSFTYNGKAVKSQLFKLENGLFLDYFEDETEKNEYWDASWGESPYKQTKKANQSTEYLEKGKVKNHLKNGVWTERKFDVEYDGPVISNGSYLNGLKQGLFSEQIFLRDFDNPLTFSGHYEKGIKSGNWTLKYENNLIVENQFGLTDYGLTIGEGSVSKRTVINSTPDKWLGMYSLKTARTDKELNEIKQIVFSVNISKEHVFVHIDSKNPEDFACEGEYFIIDSNKTIIYCKGKCDTDSLHDFQLKIENGAFYIKSNFFIQKGWIQVQKQ